MSGFIFLFLTSSATYASPPPTRGMDFHLFDFHLHVDAVADENGLDEFPFDDFAEGHHRAFKHARAHEQADRDGQSQQSVRDALAELRAFGELRVGVDLVVVARQPGEIHDVVFGHRARRRW